MTFIGFSKLLVDHIWCVHALKLGQSGYSGKIYRKNRTCAHTSLSNTQINKSPISTIALMIDEDLNFLIKIFAKNSFAK
jgi:hypothetical protein